MDFGDIGLLIGLIIIIFWIFQWMDFQQNKKIIDSERQAMLAQPIPNHILKSMEAFVRGDFDGEDQSPLAYVGYKAGKTVNMSDASRRERISICYRVNLPPELPAKYRGWGRPASYQRFIKIINHLNMLAGQRRQRRGYEIAVRHWSSDREWFIERFKESATRFGKYGYRR
jgi:hypothetical protein